MKLTTKTKPAIEYYLECILVEQNFSKTTVYSYRNFLNKFSEWFQDQGYSDLLELNQDVVSNYRLYLSNLISNRGDNLSARTQNLHAFALRSLLRFLIERGFEVLNPKDIKIKKANSKVTKFFNPKQIRKLLDAPELSKPSGLRDRTIMEVLFSTGLRVSELVALNKHQVDLDSRQFGIVGKGGKTRLIFLSYEAARWIARYLNSRLDEWEPLFTRIPNDGTHPYRNGEKMRLGMRSIQRIVEKYCVRARLPFKITPHGIRHSFATNLLNNGASIMDLKEILGHSSLESTQIYAHVTQDRLKQVHEKYHSKI